MSDVYKHYIIQIRNVSFTSKTITGYGLAVNKICYDIQTQSKFATALGQEWNDPRICSVESL